MKKTYTIKYKALSSIDAILKEGTIKVKNKESPLHAQISLETYLKTKLPAFNKLIVISCTEDNLFSNPFKDIFGFDI